MSATRDEIHKQPDAWLKAAAAATQYVSSLPRPGETVAVVGCGTSWFMAQAYARIREAAGEGWTDAIAASEMPHRNYDRVLAITRSGTTTEVLDLVHRMRGQVPTLAITSDLSTPIVAAADETIDLSFAGEESVVQTVFATACLSLLRASLGWNPAEVAQAARSALAQQLPAALTCADQWTFLGYDWSVGLAEEAALKMREACLAWTEAYPAMEYRHGPISIAQPGRAVWCLGRAPDGLAEQVAATGADFVQYDEDPQVSLVRVHQLALVVAARKGIDPDHPRNLTRSVVLS
ncbi:MAG TPA: SIS domain-containing protein [Jatrophihabitans sp.]|jgi:fructoselysine-6-P-deglycase FrlB-like protein